MKAQKLDWSDVPYVLAVCEAGSLSAASRVMGVNHSTVFRRVEGVEARLGVRLFERLSHGYVMTPAGEHFYQYALSLREGMNKIQLEIGGRDLRLEGALTVTTTDSLLHCLARVFLDFQDEHPDVELRLLSDARALDLMQRDADLALRPTQNPPAHWIGRKIMPIVCATYAHKSYWKAVMSLPAEHHRWVKLDDDLDQSPMSQITSLQKPKDAKVTVVNTMMGVFEMVRLGLGIAALPCYLGETCPSLVRVQEPNNRADWDLWLLAHPDVRRSARVHAFFEFATKNITADLLGIPSEASPG